MTRHSLSSRIVLMIGVTVTLILGAAAVAMDNLIDVEMSQRFDASLVSQARAVAALIQADDGQASLDKAQRTPSQLLIGEAGASYVVRCPGRLPIHSQPAPQAHPEQWLKRASDQPAFVDLEVAGKTLRAVWFKFDPNGKVVDGPAVHHDSDLAACTLLWMQPRREVDDILATIDAILWIIPLLALVTVLLLTPALVRRGLRPLAMLGERMRSIGPSVPDERLPSGETHELVPLAERFNEVLDRMQAGMVRERRFAGALAHETRTRLAELRALVDVERRYPGDRSLSEVLGEVGAIGGELEDTVTGLLLLTRLEAGIESVRRQKVDVAAVIDKQLEAVADMAVERGIRIRREPPPQALSVIADASVLGIVLANLLRNAVAYAPRNSSVHLWWDASGLRLSNAAPDLTTEDVAQFGRRYWRKQTGEPDSAHAGLGLSLAAAAAAALELQLRFEIRDGQELLATLAWSAEPIRGEA